MISLQQTLQNEVSIFQQLQKQIEKLEIEIVTIKQSDTFKTIIDIADWDNYFQNTKQQLQIELDNLKQEFQNN